MPPRHHRTVDRTVAIMEVASRATSGVSLAELSTRLDAPKSSIQELTNGLLATGYLVERERRFLLGPGAFVLSPAHRRACRFARSGTRSSSARRSALASRCSSAPASATTRSSSTRPARTC